MSLIKVSRVSLPWEGEEVYPLGYVLKGFVAWESGRED